MTDETRVALKNYEHLLREYGWENVELVWHTDSVIYGSDGCSDIDMLIRPGFTPATECFARTDD